MQQPPSEAEAEPQCREGCSETMTAMRLGTLGVGVTLGAVAVSVGSVERDEPRRATAQAAAAPPSDYYSTRCSQPRIVSRLFPTWPRRSVTAHGVSLLGLRTDWVDRPASAFAPSGSDEYGPKYRPIRAPIRIATRGSVRVAIAPESRSRAGFAYAPYLLWGQKARDGVHISEAHRVVTLRRCYGQPTVFEGGVVVAEPMCVQLDFYRPGSTEKTRRVAPVGRKSC